MYLLSYELRPSASNPQQDGIGGAFVSAWVKSASLESARERARTHLRDSGWEILTEVKEQAVARGSVPPESMEYMRQAETDGEVFVIHAFPPGEPDA